MTLLKRARARTPRFFRILRNLGLAAAAVSAALLQAPVDLPASVGLLAGYLALGGSVMAAVSQLTSEEEITKKEGSDGT